jgi:NADH-quinone oxidoreductase subunit J
VSDHLHPVLAAVRVESVVFIIAAGTSLLSALGMVFIARNAVYAALLLVLNFFMLAVMFVLLDAHFLAAVQVIVYAGAIMVLFLFVIMLLGVDRDEPVQVSKPWYYTVVGFAVSLFAILIYTIRTTLTDVPFRGLEQANQSGNTEEVGRLLFTKYLFPFEVTSILLIVAAIGAMILARRRAPGEPDVAADEEPEVRP